MTKNEKQYKVAQAMLEKWQKNLEIHKKIKQPGIPAWSVKEQAADIGEQVRQLQAEIKEYEETIAAGLRDKPKPD